MTTISIPDDTYRLLAARASALNTTAEALAAAALGQIARAPDATPPEPSTAERDAAFAALQQLVGGLDVRFPPGHRLDDSREAIYAQATGEAAMPPDAVSPAEWLRRRAEWKREVEDRADRYPPGYVADDSREAIYAEREGSQR